MTSLKKFVGSVILSYTGDICKICKKDGWLFATHSFTNSRQKVRKWLANWTIMTQAVFNWKWLTLQFLAALKCSENLDAVGLLGFNLWKWIWLLNHKGQEKIRTRHKLLSVLIINNKWIWHWLLNHKGQEKSVLIINSPSLGQWYKIKKGRMLPHLHNYWENNISPKRVVCVMSSRFMYPLEYLKKIQSCET